MATSPRSIKTEEVLRPTKVEVKVQSTASFPGETGQLRPFLLLSLNLLRDWGHCCQERFLSVCAALDAVQHAPLLRCGGAPGSDV